MAPERLMTAKGIKPPVSPMRGELYWLDFAPATGHEMTGDHPCLVVQNDVGNRLSALTIVAAITTSLRAASLPIGILLPAGTGGLKQDSVVHCGQLRLRVPPHSWTEMIIAGEFLTQPRQRQCSERKSKVSQRNVIEARD
jgi:mRNA-degrading endonuclease toxin of MazEF toxin-antitoxin module